MRFKSRCPRCVSFVAIVYWSCGVCMLAGCGGSETNSPADDGNTVDNGTPDTSDQPEPEATEPAETPVAASPTDADLADMESKIRQVFASYRSALSEADGEAAGDLVSADTLTLHQQHRDRALTADAATVKGLTPVNRMSVLLLRHCVEPAVLQSMDGRAVFVHAVQEGWIGKDSAVQAGLGKVTVSGLTAAAEATMGDTPTEEEFHFVKEGGNWKLDLLPALEKANGELQGLAQKESMSENEFIFSAITSLSGQQVTDQIWQPLE